MRAHSLTHTRTHTPLFVDKCLMHTRGHTPQLHMHSKHLAGAEKVDFQHGHGGGVKAGETCKESCTPSLNSKNSKNSLAKHDSSSHKATTCTYLKLESQNWARKTMIAGIKRLSPNFQDTDVIALAVILFQLAAVSRTKDVMKPLPLMFSFSNRAFLCEGCISTTETVFHRSGWHGTPAAHVLCWTPIQHKDFSSSHCYGVKDTERQTMIVMMFTKRQAFSFHRPLSSFGHFPHLQAAANHVTSRKPDVMTAQSRANNAEDKQW